MKKDNNIEVILFPEFFLASPNQEALINWLTITVQPVVVKQQELTKKLSLRTLTDSPAIYMS
jgi:hypothetical protein